MTFYKKYKIRLDAAHKRYMLKNPWINSYRHARSRCLNKADRNFKNYGGRGIKFLMTLEDFKFLWFRDKAYDLKQPSIDRIDNDGDYTLNNCRFIEKVFNTRGKAK